jgi:GNAT superfamily N-acetyltransferase
MAVEQINDRNELREFLLRDKVANAYLLGDLDPAYLPFCSWYGARQENDDLESLVLIYQGLSLPVVLMLGAPSNFEDFLVDVGPHLPERFHFHVLEHHIDTVRHVFDCADTMRMHRMGLGKPDYQTRGPTEAVERLGHRDTAAIMELYEHYPDNFFEPSQLETGLYFGIREKEGGLMSIAGVHVVSEEYDVAIIGNLVTHPNGRGQGLATKCTGRLLDELFERVSLVALNVQETNEPAIKMYKNFGFEENNIFWEGRCSAPPA